MSRSNVGSFYESRHDDFLYLAERLLALPLVADDPMLRARVLILCQTDEILAAQEDDLLDAYAARRGHAASMHETLRALSYLWLDGLYSFLNEWQDRRCALEKAHDDAQVNASDEYFDVRNSVPALEDIVERFCDDSEYRAAIEQSRQDLDEAWTLLGRILQPVRKRSYSSESEHLGQIWAAGPIDSKTGSVHMTTNLLRPDVSTRRAVTDALRVGLGIVPGGDDAARSHGTTTHP